MSNQNTSNKTNVVSAINEANSIRSNVIRPCSITGNNTSSVKIDTGIGVGNYGAKCGLLLISGRDQWQNAIRVLTMVMVPDGTSQTPSLTKIAGDSPTISVANENGKAVVTVLSSYGISLNATIIVAPY